MIVRFSVRIFCAALLVSTSALAHLESSVEGLTIGNSHDLSKAAGRVIRGSQPLSKVGELADLGVTDVLVLKTQTNTEVDDELAALAELGYAESSLKWIEFPWRGVVVEDAAQTMKNTIKACKQIITGLQLLQKVSADADRSIFFHCTVGEDRTGLLAGLYRMSEQNWTEKKAYQKEMCARGFAEGNPNKPAHVAKTVRTNLLPVFKMAAGAIAYARENGVAVKPSHCKAASIEGFNSATYPKCN